MRLKKGGEIFLSTVVAETKDLPNEAITLKTSVLSWLETMHNKSEPVWHYRLFKGSDATVYTSCFAVYLRYLFNDLSWLEDSEKQDWVKYLKSFQDPQSGLFCGPEAKERVVDERHDVQHLNHQLTTFCISALRCFGETCRYPLKFIDAWKDADRMVRWLDGLNWQNPWNSGNKVMFLGILLLYNYEHFGDQQAIEALDVWFDWMDHNQKPENGFWGTSRSSDYFYGMGGFYHQFVIYNYVGRKVRYAERVVDRNLLLQQPDGLFCPEGGGKACDDIDGIDPLVHFYHRYDYRRNDIKAALKRALNGILKNQNPDGGFCWSKHYWYDFKRYWDILSNFSRHRDSYYTYLCTRGVLRGQKKDLFKIPVATGWTQIHRKERESNIFDTWFRCVSIGEICTVLTEDPYASLHMQFLSTPGVGWFNV